MQLNGIDIINYKAVLLDKHIENAAISTVGEWADGWIAPVTSNQYFKYVKITCEIEINANTEEEAEKNISQIIKLAGKSRLEFEDFPLKYDGILETISKEQIIRGNYLLSLVWKCGYGMEDEITEEITTSKKITLNSTADTPAIIEISPNGNIEEVEIKGFGEKIALYNLTVGNKIIINGESGLVTEDGENKYTDYESWGFPKLIPGENNIITDVPITIRYSPRWL